MRATYPTYKSTSIPWMPEMPEHWDLIGLNLLFRDNKNKNKGMVESLVLSLSYGNIIRKQKEENYGLIPESFETYQIVEPGYIVLRLTDLQNDKRSLRVGYVKERGIITSAYTGLIPIKVDSRYYYYLLHYLDIRKHFYSLGGGVRQSSDYNEIKKTKVPFPLHTEQTAIANYLDAKTEQISRFIAKKEKLIALLKEQKQALINELLEDKEGKWERRKLKYVGRMINGYAFNSEEFLTEGTIKVIKIANIQPMRMDWTEKSFIPESYFEKQKQFSVKRGDLVFALTRPIIKEGIKVAFIDSEEKLLVNQRNAILKPRKNVTKDWLYYCFLTSRFISEFDKQIDKTGQQPNIATEDIGNIKIPFPKLNIQDEVVATIKQETYKIDAVISRIERELEKVQELKQSLIAEVVTGRIKVA
jgi:type I restriction enzyme S subunit